jgi:hypothetical protein
MLAHVLSQPTAFLMRAAFIQFVSGERDDASVQRDGFATRKRC